MAAMKEGVANSENFLVLLTPKYATSKFCVTEARDAMNGKKSSVVAFDYTQHDFESLVGSFPDDVKAWIRSLPQIKFDVRDPTSIEKAFDILVDEGRKAAKVIVISTPYGGRDAPGPNKKGAALASTLKAKLSAPGTFVFNPNTDLGDIARRKGWTQAEQDKRWLKIFTDMVRLAKEKQAAGSQVRMLCHGEKPVHPNNPGPELVGYAQPGELNIALLAGFTEQNGGLVFDVY